MPKYSANKVSTKNKNARAKHVLASKIKKQLPLNLANSSTDALSSKKRLFAAPWTLKPTTEANAVVKMVNIAIWPYSVGVRYLVKTGNNTNGIAALAIELSEYIRVFFNKAIPSILDNIALTRANSFSL